MFKNFCIKVGRFLAPQYIAGLEARAKDAEAKAVDFELKINQRVAEYVARMDPFEPLMKQFHGVFSEEFEHPEEKLDDRSKLSFFMWAYQQKHDPHFKFMLDWIMNTQGNATLKRGNPTPDTILYGRSQISNLLLFKKEIGRLSLLYEEVLAKSKGEEIDPSVTVE